MELVFVRLLFVLLIFIGVVLLQVFLSKRENKWAGRILPLLFFLFSLIYPLSLSAVGQSIGELIVPMLIVLLMANIPTAILLVIYFACRSSRNNRQEIDKMNIQDLN